MPAYAARPGTRAGGRPVDCRPRTARGPAPGPAGAQPRTMRQNLVADLRHRRFVAGLDVQAQQGLGVGGAQVEPPVLGGDGQAVELVQGEAVLVRVRVADRRRPGRPGRPPWS